MNMVDYKEIKKNKNLKKYLKKEDEEQQTKEKY